MRLMDKDLCDLNESRAEGHIDDEKKLWLGNLDADLTKGVLLEWLRNEKVHLMYQPRDFVPWRCKSGWRHDFLYRVPPTHTTPPLTPELPTLIRCPLASAHIRCHSVSTPRPSHELSLHLLVYGGGGRDPARPCAIWYPAVGLVLGGR